MVKRIGGSRRKTRTILRKPVRARGKMSLSAFFQEFEVGDKVILKAESSYQKGMYHPRFHARPGQVTGKRGNCYHVAINDQGKAKLLIVHPVHLKRL